MYSSIPRTQGQHIAVHWLIPLGLQVSYKYLCRIKHELRVINISNSLTIEFVEFIISDSFRPAAYLFSRFYILKYICVYCSLLLLLLLLLLIAHCILTYLHP